MESEVMGVPLSRFGGPIEAALKRYQEITEGKLAFDAQQATKLEPTPELANSARTATDVRMSGDNIGKLYVIAFKPGDGTGSEVSYKLDDLKVELPYPRKVLIVPRQKTGTYNEGHMTIATHKIDNVHAEPILFDGRFDLVGLKGKTVTKIGELGHPENPSTIGPLTTMTVGYLGLNRFGDPHSVFNPDLDRIQVCAFLGISNEINQKYPDVLNLLKPNLPRN